MTRGERDYSQGKIYKIVCNITGKKYIGSTTKKYLSKRLSQHKSDYNQWKKEKKGYISSFEIIEEGNYDIILIENYPCNDVNELFSREKYWIENIEGGCLNKVLPIRSTEEKQEIKTNYNQQYWQKNKEEIIKKNRKYWHEHKEEIYNKHKQYIEEHKQDIQVYQRQYQPQWYLKNKKDHNKKSKEWYEKNKKELLEKRNTKMTCECGATISKNNISTHKKTKKHEDNMNKKYV